MLTVTEGAPDAGGGTFTDEESGVFVAVSCAGAAEFPSSVAVIMMTIGVAVAVGVGNCSDCSRICAWAVIVRSKFAGSPALLVGRLQADNENANIKNRKKGFCITLIFSFVSCSLHRHSAATDHFLERSDLIEDGLVDGILQL